MSAGYIYVKNWKNRQHHKYESPPWHKVYNNTLRDDDYLRLSHADRGLLHDLWTLASLAGDGRVSADRTFLARQLNVRRVSLEPLIQAGFIEVMDTKRVRDESESVTTELSREENPLTPAERGNGLRANGENPRALAAVVQHDERRRKQLRICQRMWREGIENGEPREYLREALAREFPHDPTIVTDAEPAVKETA